MKKIICSLVLALSMLIDQVNASSTHAPDPTQCPYPNIVGSIGLNQVDRASLGVFVFREDHFGTAQQWAFSLGAFSNNLTDAEAINEANTTLPSMGLLFGPLQDSGQSLCVYYSPTSSVVGVAGTGISNQDLKLVIHHQVPILQQLLK